MFAFLVRALIASFIILYFSNGKSLRRIFKYYIYVSLIIGFIMVLSELFTEDRREYLKENWYRYFYVGFKFPMYILYIVINGEL